MGNKMFCYQCQETVGNQGCTISGVCGKNAETSALQDVLLYVTRGLAQVTGELRRSNKPISKEVNHLITENLFVTITNANFDDTAIVQQILMTVEEKKLLLAKIENASTLSQAAIWTPASKEEMLEIAPSIGILATSDDDIRSLRWLVIYGLKGMAAYAKHASNLCQDNEEIDAFLQDALAKTLDDTLTVNDLIALTLETGKHGVSVMALLDKANTDTYGNPEISKVNLGVRNKPSILISGHDLKDLEQLLEQTKGKGVDVYTHSEMLPAHYYPFFKKYDNLVGNYGNAWWKQKEEFESFSGPILMTTNCLVPPKASYMERVYTTGPVGFTGCKYIKKDANGEKDFSEIIQHAKKCPPPKELEQGELVGGFAHTQVVALADKVVEAVKSGAIKKFVVMAGCDGRAKGRDYYTDFAKELPKDTVILTAGCAKYRYNKLQLGDIGGIPRVLDAGQCNDSYSLAVIAIKLKEVFGLDDINELPIIYNIAWYEQKAVIVLLALLSLGVKNIHLGPTLPAFLSPNVAKVLVENFGIAGIGTAKNDIKLFFGDVADPAGGATQDMTIGEVLQLDEKVAQVLTGFGMHCLGCPSSRSERLGDACIVHGISLDEVIEKINGAINSK